MSTFPFPVGTIVWLRSGGPSLTVADYYASAPDRDLVSVEWFAGDVFKRDVIHKDCLTTEKPNG